MKLACGCSKIACAASALQTYAQVFEEEGALDRLEAFASLNGPRFYDLPVNEGTITLTRAVATLGESLLAGAEEVTVFRGGEPLAWSLA